MVCVIASDERVLVFACVRLSVKELTVLSWLTLSASAGYLPALRVKLV